MQEVNARAALPPARHNNPIMMAVFVAGLLLYGIVVFSECFESDVWYLLATGREIVENGIPYENPFTYHDNMQIIVQQYALCMLLYGIYSMGGFVAVAAWTVLMAAVLALSLYCLGRVFKRDWFGGEWLLALALLCMPVFELQLGMSANVYSMIAICWVLFFCEKYRQDGNWAWLATLLPLAIVHAAFQMSYVLFDLVIVGCYAIPDFLKPLHKRDKLLGIQFSHCSYKRLPLVIAMIGVFTGACINPYGIRGALYVFLSYSSTVSNPSFSWMGTVAPRGAGISGFLLVFVILLAFVAIGKRGCRRIDLPLVLLLVISSGMAFTHAINVWIAMPFAYAIIADAMHGWSIDFSAIHAWFVRCKARITLWRLEHSHEGESDDSPLVSEEKALLIRKASSEIKVSKIPRKLDSTVRYFAAGGICCIAMLVMVLGISQFAHEIADKENTDTYSPTALIDYMADDMDANGFTPNDVRIFNPVRLGGYLEWRGYDVFVDSRIEAYNSLISGSGRDYYKEYVDLLQSGEKPSDENLNKFVDEFEFNYMFAESGSPLETFLEEGDKYSQLISNDNYSLWKQRTPLDD